MPAQLEDILSLPTAFLVLGIYITAFIIRRFAEAVWPTLSNKTPVSRAERVWEEAILPSLPAVLGVPFCILVPPKVYAYPAVVAASLPSRALYGMGAGWFSAWGYKVLKFVLQKKWNIPFPDDGGT